MSDDPISPPLTSSAVGSPVRTSAMLAGNADLMESGPASGLSTHESLASYDHATSSWRTSQLSFLGDSELFSETWPRSGMMRSGTAFPLPPWANPRDVGACSLLPTLTVGDSKGTRNGTASTRQPSDGLTFCDWMWLRGERQRPHPEFAEWVQGFPTGWTELPPLATP